MKIFFISLLLLTNRCWSQKNTENVLILKIDPLAFFPPYSGPSLRVGVEYKVKNKWFIYNEAGYYLPIKNEEYAPLVTKGYTGKIELKYYFSNLSGKSEKTSSQYVSAELFYKYHYYSTSDSILSPPIKYNKDYFVKKNVEAFTIKYGGMTVYKSGFIVDVYIGLGIRLKQSRNLLTKEENQNIVSSSDYDPNIFTNKAGNFLYPNFSLGIKIGYRIK